MSLAVGPGPHITKSFPEIPCLTPLCFSLVSKWYACFCPCEIGLCWPTDILHTLSILWCLAHSQMAPFLLTLYLELQSTVSTVLPWQLASFFKQHVSSRLVFQIPFHPNPCNQHCLNSSARCLRLKQKNLGNRCLCHCFITDTLSTFFPGCIVLTHTLFLQVKLRFYTSVFIFSLYL